jgi:uncharacterized protein YbbC (DUF1343 family)
MTVARADATRHIAFQEARPMRTATGLELAFETHKQIPRGASIGLLCHPASVDARLRHASEIFTASPEIRLRALFGPQHGYLGNTQDNMIEWSGFTHPQLGIPVYSLYGEHRKPASAMLDGLDALVCDLMDVGTRVYTFIWTMCLCMEACSEAGIPFVVLDRPNPIGGEAVEGNVLDPAVRSFVGLHPIPMRHGLTPGEVALFVNETAGVGCDLRVVPMKGWRRDMLFGDTGLPWVLPSPNMPTPDTALVYPGTVAFEGANVSEGRGTCRPFELIGAPWLDAEALAKSMNARNLPGAYFRAAWFEPVFHKGAGKICGGVQIHVTDPYTFKPYLTGLALLQDCRGQSPEKFAWKQPPYEYEFDKLPIDLILGDSQVRRGIEDGIAVQQLEEAWTMGLTAFRELKKQYHLYD